jgi:hypothetical protein
MKEMGCFRTEGRIHPVSHLPPRCIQYVTFEILANDKCSTMFLDLLTSTVRSSEENFVESKQKHVQVPFSRTVHLLFEPAGIASGQLV